MVMKLISFIYGTIENKIKATRLVLNTVPFIVFFTILIGFGSPAFSQTQRILVMGDSLSAGYNLPQSASFPSQLETWLQEQGLDVAVQNAGVSGDTSAGGRSRLSWAMAGNPEGNPHLVIIEFGGNDALRGIEPSDTYENLSAMIQQLNDMNIPVLLAGMRAPPNMGREYENEFNALFPRLAEDYDIAFYPFFLKDVAAIPHLNLNDGIHPNEEGIAVIVENIGPMVLGLVRE